MQFKTSLKLYLPPLTILLGTFLICYFVKMPNEVLMSDPLWLVDALPWVGAVSNIGILIWTISISVCFFTGALLSQRRGDKNRVRFLYAVGGITILIMLDDFFMLHELIYSKYLHLDENLVFSFYGMLILVCFIKFRGLILKSDYSTLITSLVFFALSAAFDTLHRYHTFPWHRFYEDGFKLLGIFGWAGYFVKLCSDFLSSKN